MSYAGHPFSLRILSPTDRAMTSDEESRIWFLGTVNRWKEGCDLVGIFFLIREWDSFETILSRVCGVFLVDILLPQFKLAHYWKAIEVKRCKTTRTKEHSKQSNTNKIKFIYLQIHKGNITKHYEYSNIICWIFLYVCAYVYVTNTDIMEKDKILKVSSRQ